MLPGNVFAGSAIWNPTFIKKTAKKLGIKPSEVRAFYDAKVPLGRSCDPQDIANAVAFLASPDAGYITRSTLCVDGGISM